HLVRAAVGVVGGGIHADPVVLHTHGEGAAALQLAGLGGGRGGGRRRGRGGRERGRRDLWPTGGGWRGPRGGGGRRARLSYAGFTGRGCRDHQRDDEATT